MLLRRRGRSSDPPSIREIARRIAGFPIVSCDIFDTALIRRLARPEDVLLAAGARARARGLVDCAPEAFREFRLEAERVARSAAEAAGHDEVTIAEIYRQLAECGVIDRADVVPQLAMLEFETERSVCVAAEPLRAVLTALDPRQRLVFASDTTLPGEWLTALLAGCGYPGGMTVFSSADARRSKHTGRLFATMLQALGCAPGQVVHLGDNPESDVARAREHGIVAIHVPQRARSPEAETTAKAHYVVRLLHSNRRSLAEQAHDKTAPAVGIALHRYVTALLLGFTLFVVSEARRRGTRRIYFLSRDGYLPYMLAARLGPRLTGNLELTYLHVSRRSIAVPAQIADLSRLATDVAESLAGQPISLALEFLGYDRTATATMLRDLGVDPERRAGRRFGHDEIQRLFVARHEQILERLMERRAAALAYLEQTGFLDPGPRLVVDVGWRGTTQEALSTLTGAPAGEIAGCYLGLWPQSLRSGLDPRVAGGYLFTFGHPRPMMDIVRDGYILLELFFSAPHSTVLHYECDAMGRAQPVHAAESEPAGTLRRTAMQELEAACLREIAEVDAILGGDWPKSIDPDSAILDLRGLLTQPSMQEVAAINRIPFIHGIADTANNTVAVNQLPWRDWIRPKAMIRRIEQAPWRAGSTRISLPAAVPSVTFRELEYRVAQLYRLFGRG